jgi:aminopeptidase-like protein
MTDLRSYGFDLLSRAAWPERGFETEPIELNQLLSLCEGSDVGQEIFELITELYPICRSITGDGVRKTFSLLERFIPLQLYEVPSGTPVLDWTVPKEWNIRDAYVVNSRGERVIDFQQNCLHVVGYSVPVKKKFSLKELKKHLFTIPERPEWIPFRYSYYDANWGFCLAHRDLEEMEDGEYEVVIDSTLEDGFLTYGEYYLPGASSDELLISIHIDHPAMCNDNLSGVAVGTFLAAYLSRIENRRLSYRFIFIPTTIGSITWLSRNEANLDRIKYGFTLTCIGDDGGFTWKETRRGGTAIDRAVKCALRESKEEYELWGFTPFGFDERQFCSPGFDLPVGSLFRTYSHHYPENHTSADDLTLMSPEKLGGSLGLLARIVTILEGDAKYFNTSPKGEPQLGKRGIYRKMGGPIIEQNLVHLFWVLNYSDGEHSLLDIAEMSHFQFSDLRKAADILLDHGLLATEGPLLSRMNSGNGFPVHPEDRGVRVRVED